MKVIFDSGIDQHQGHAKQTKNYQIGNQIFQVHISSYNQGSYTIARLAEDGHFEYLEGLGDSWTGKITVDFTDVHYVNGEGLKANWNEVWKKLENQVTRYAEILERKEDKSQEPEIKLYKCWYADPEDVGINYTIQKWDGSLECENCGKIGSYYMINEKEKIGCCIEDFMKCSIFKKVEVTSQTEIESDMHTCQVCTKGEVCSNPKCSFEHCKKCLGFKCAGILQELTIRALQDEIQKLERQFIDLYVTNNGFNEDVIRYDALVEELESRK